MAVAAGEAGIAGLQCGRASARSAISGVSSARSVLFLLDALALNIAFIAAYLLRFELLKGVQITTPFINEPLAKFSSWKSS